MKYKIMKRFSALILLAGMAQAFLPVTSAHAQILSRGDLFGPGAPPPMVGIEIGIGKHAEIGTLDCSCGSQFTGGTGTGLLGSLFFELPIDYEWTIGIKAGIDFKNFSTTSPAEEQVVVPIPKTVNEDTNLLVSDSRIGSVKTTYIDFAPYVQYQFFRMGPFVQAGVDFGFLIANSLTVNRQLPEGTSAVIRGQPDNNLTFSNGTLTEQVQAGPSGAASLRLGLLLSAGYNIQVSERSVFAPLITYDFPLTAAGTVNGSPWKIGSLYASALLKFQL